MKMEIYWILSHPLSLKLKIWLIELHSAIVLSLRLPNFFTSAVKCRLKILTPWWSCGQHIQHCEILRTCPLWTFCPSLTTRTSMVQLMPYQLVVCHGKASLSHMMVPSPRIPPHGQTLNICYGLEILAYSSRSCLKTPIPKTPLITHHFGNMIQMTNAVTKVLCQVTGYGNKL